MGMNRDEIELAVLRLSPWYYLYDLGGVRTDIASPCDGHGYRTATIPEAVSRYLRGKTILDVACNEGQYAFEAIKRGAVSVVGFDCRSINVEKANFAARVLGINNVTFCAGSVDSWPRKQYDIIFMCGIVYHLPKPWRAIRKFARMAREGILVTSVLGGGRDGWSRWREGDTIASSECSEVASRMPNTTMTLLREYARHGFTPAYLEETAWGPNGERGCAVFFRRKEHILDQLLVGVRRLAGSLVLLSRGLGSR